MTAPRWTLDFDVDRTTVGDANDALLHVPLTPAVLAQRHWRSGRPTALALERAIDDIEAAIEATGARHEAGRTLSLSVRAQETLASLDARAPVLSREAIERCFSALIRDAEALRSSAGHDAADNAAGEAAAGLVMVRELMHHLGFEQLQRPHP